MPRVPPPNQDLVNLSSLLGEDNVRMLVRTFLRDYPGMLNELSTGDRLARQRVTHSLKSNARILGAHALSADMAAYEARLANKAEPDLAAPEIKSITVAINTMADGLKDFAAP